MPASPKRPLTADEADAIVMLSCVTYPVASWDKRFAAHLWSCLKSGQIGVKAVPQLWRIFIRYRRQTSGARKAELLKLADGLAAVDYRKQARIDEAKAKYATAMRDGYEVPLIGVPKSAEPSKGDFQQDPQPL
jgi:hypothetical protein